MYFVCDVKTEFDTLRAFTTNSTELVAASSSPQAASHQQSNIQAGELWPKRYTFKLVYLRIIGLLNKTSESEPALMAAYLDELQVSNR